MEHEMAESGWETARDIVRLVRELGRNALENDLDERYLADEPDPDAIESMVGAGLFRLTIPRRYGGLGRDYAALAAACEELGRIDSSHQVSLTVHLALASASLLQWGTEDQRDWWLPALASGERIGTFGLTEPGAGSDVGALRMRARAVEGGYLLNGEKSWISLATVANLFLLFATIDPERRHRGITAFIVPGEAPGLTTTRLHGKLGVRAGDTGSVFCDNVFVAGGNMLGEPGEGFAVALSALGNGLFTVGCGALGIAAACRDWTAARLRERGDASGWAAGELAAMTARVTAARALVERAAALKNEGQPSARETSVAKWTASEAALANAEGALRIFQTDEAGESVTLQRMWANAKATVIYGGTSEIHQTMQGAYALGDRIERPFRRPLLSAADLA